MKKTVRILISCAVAIVVLAIFCAVIIGCNIDYPRWLVYLMILVSISAGKLVNDWLKTDKNNHGEENNNQQS